MEARALSEPSDLRSAGWRAVAASVRGRGHQQRGQPCQDACGLYVTGDGRLIAAVADGAGSADRAEEGSALAIEVALASLYQALADAPLALADTELAMAAAFADARAAIGAHADEQQAPLADFHTTLLCAVVTGDSITVGHIGDGVAVIEDDRGQLATIARPEHGEYANSTYFLTQLPELADRLHIRTIPGSARAIALTTDGLLDVAFSDPDGDCTPWANFFTPLFERVRREPAGLDLTPKLAELLGSPKIRNQTSDDVTLVIAIREELADSEERAGEEIPAHEPQPPEESTTAPASEIGLVGEAPGDDDDREHDGAAVNDDVSTST